MVLDSEELFAGSPKDTFFDIVYNANRNLVEHEIEDLIERLALLEMLLEKNGVEDIDKKISELKYSEAEQLEDEKRSIFIHSTGNIVTRNE